MTPADLAMKNAIAFECKKDGLRQTQAGTWKVTFTVLDMDERLTRAFPGTRYQAVLVEIDDNELPVHQPAKESSKALAEPQLAALDKSQPVGAKREEIEPLSEKGPATRYAEVAAKREKMDWRELQPAAQAGIRCEDLMFQVFLKEEYYPHWSRSALDAAVCVRLICGVESRKELGTNHKARVLWKQLDDHFMSWKMMGRVGA